MDGKIISFSLHTVVNFARAVIGRCPWSMRTDKRYTDDVTGNSFFQHGAWVWKCLRDHFKKFSRSCLYRGYYMVARRYEFYFRVAKQYFTNERSEWVKYCFCHEKIKFISSSCRVMFFLLYRQKDIDKIIDFYSPKSNCDGSNLQYSNIRHCLQ